MQHRRSLLAPLTYLAAALALVAAGGSLAPLPAEGARASSRGGATTEWTVQRVRFEPLDETSGPFTIEGLRSYRGSIEVTTGRSGLAVVNQVGLEDYVKGIAEVPPKWPAAALEAQAIAARTFALNQMGNNAATESRAVGADICATDACQVYIGLASEQREGGARWAEAVDSTAGQVLLADDRPILAKYSSSNGGRSVSGGTRYLRAIDDPDDARSPLHRWSYARPLAEVAGALGIEPPSQLAAIQRRGDTIVMSLRAAAAPPPAPAPPPTEPPPPAEPPPPPDGAPSGETLQILTPPPTPPAPPPTAPPPPPETRTESAMSTNQFVAALNKNLPRPAGLPLPLPSWQFSVETSGPDAVFNGRGHGHGVGMSQYGAYGRALRGESASDILAAYYGGIRPTSLSGDRLPASIKVALALDRPDVSVAGLKYFRVVDGAGNVIAPVAVGNWRVTAGSNGGVRVSAPEGWGAPLSLTPVGVDPAEPRPHDITLVRFSVSAPAVLHVSFTPPGSVPGANPPRAVDAGEVAELLPSPEASGDYHVTIRADAGPGREAVLPVTFRTAGPPPEAVAGQPLVARPGGSTAAAPSGRRVLLAASGSRTAPPWLMLAALVVVWTATGSGLLLASRRT